MNPADATWSSAARDVVLRPGPGVPEGLRIPAGELEERFSRSPGPGGQSVNTTDTRVELEWDPARSAVLSDVQRERLADAGVVLSVAHEHRSQYRNRTAARERLADRIRELLSPPPPRRKRTRPSRGAKERRLAEKKRRGTTKAMRGRVRDQGSD